MHLHSSQIFHLKKFQSDSDTAFSDRQSGSHLTETLWSWGIADRHAVLLLGSARILAVTMLSPIRQGEPTNEWAPARPGAVSSPSGRTEGRIKKAKKKVTRLTTAPGSTLPTLHQRASHGALGRRKTDRELLWTCSFHRRHFHRGYPIVLPYPRAILGILSHSYTSTFLRASGKRKGGDVIKTNFMESEIQMRMVNPTKPFNALNVRN